MNNSGIPRLEEQGARILAQMARNSPKFLKPYMHSILKTLLPKLRPDIRYVEITVAVLNAISELSQVGSAELVLLLDTLIPILIDFLQHTNSLARREVTRNMIQ